MKIATWNVNSLTARHQHVLDWLAAQSQASAPIDVLCLQELKLTDDKFPFEALAAAGYHAAAFGQKTYNGVAILSRTGLGAPRDVVRNIPGFADEQSRVIAATLDAPGGPLRIVNGYFVNGQEPGSEKFAYKMKWLQALHDWLQTELAAHPRLVLLGDFNITPEDRDSYDPEGLRETIHHTTEERDWFRRLVGLGLTDSFRLFEQPAEELFVVGLPHARLPEEPRPAHRPHPRQRRAATAGESLHDRPRAAQVGKAERPHAGDRGAVRPCAVASGLIPGRAEPALPVRCVAPQWGEAAAGRFGGRPYHSRPSSWILRVMVLRPMPSFCAASMRRPRVLASAVRISRDSKRRDSASHTSVRPAASNSRASASRPCSHAPVAIGMTSPP